MSRLVQHSTIQIQLPFSRTKLSTLQTSSHEWTFLYINNSTVGQTYVTAHHLHSRMERADNAS